MQLQGQSGFVQMWPSLDCGAFPLPCCTLLLRNFCYASRTSYSAPQIQTAPDTRLVTWQFKPALRLPDRNTVTHS